MHLTKSEQISIALVVTVALIAMACAVFFLLDTPSTQLDGDVTVSPSPTVTVSEEPTPEVSAKPSVTAKPSPTKTSTAKPSAKPSATVKPSVAPSIKPTVKPSVAPSSASASRPTPTSTPKSTPTPTPTPTLTPTPSPTPNGLADYVIVYSSEYASVATDLSAKIQALTGINLPVIQPASIHGKFVINVGATQWSGSLPLGCDDFSVFSSGYNLHILGGSSYATAVAAHRLVSQIPANGTAFRASSINFSYTRPDRSEYINDISRLVLHWENVFTTPSWMLNFNEKYKAMLDVDGRLISCAHRGDMVYYPENSIEGIISAIQMGCDMVEIDPRLTKDGVFVLMHDATLTRTTDFAEKAGKNGLPTSANICDWTYAQLQQLNLKTQKGGASASVTPYKIPTLEEAIKVCANRIFIRLDVKGEEGSSLPFWDFEDDIWPLLKKYNCHTTVMYTWQSFFRADNFALVKKYRKLSKQACGKAMLGFINNKSTAQDALNVIEEYGLAPMMRLTFDLSEYGYDEFLTNNKTRLKGFRGKVRLYADVHKTNSAYPQNKEGAKLYGDLYKAGINVQLVNKALMMCEYIANNFSATK